MVDLRINEAMVGDALEASSATLKVTVTDGIGATLVVLRDGAEFKSVLVDATPFVLTDSLAEGGRYRAEVRLQDQPRTVTNNLWLTLVSKPMGCDSTGAPVLLAVALALAARSRPRWS
jgi:uncharacterized protein (TIGR03382 family)